MTDLADIEARAVKDKDGCALLFDLWVNGKWIGSRRTIEQCELALSYYLNSKVGAVYGRPW